MTTITVIVPAYNAAGTLGPCLASLRRQTVRPAEIIVVDDASTDDTAAVATRYGAKLVRLAANGGPGVARNAGAAQAAGELLAFTDADCVAPADWLARMLAALDAAEVVAATGGYAGPVRDSFLARLQHVVIRERQAKLPREIQSTITSNLVCRASAFRAVGGFPLYSRRSDPLRPIWGNEDEEIGFLLARHGTIRWVADAGPFHEFRGSVRAYLRQQAFYAERIVMSHFRFKDIAGSKTNYSRSSGLLHLLAALGVVAGGSALGAALAACEHVHWPGSGLFMHGLVDELLCSAGAAAVALWLPTYALLPLPLLSRMRRTGERLLFVAKAYPLLLAVDMAWLYGAVRGTLLSLGGFLNGNR